MAIYLYHELPSKEVLHRLSQNFLQLGYENIAGPTHLPTFSHASRSVYPYVSLIPQRAQLEESLDMRQTQKVLNGLVGILRPTHWDTDLDTFVKNPETHYRSRVVIPLPYVKTARVESLNFSTSK